MKSLRLALLLSFVSASAFAQGFAVVPKISTLGYGADFIIGLSRSAQLRLGAQTGSITHELEESGAVYDGEADLSGQNLMLDLFPAGGSFRFSIGAIRNENEFSGQTNEDSLVELNGNFYPVALVGQVRASVTTEEYGPYVGFGYGNALLPGSRVRVLLDIGAYYHGEPVVALVATPNPGVPLPPGFQSNLEAEEASVQEEIKDYKIYPVISLGVSIRF